MAAFFFDTSALIKQYAREAGSEWVRLNLARNAAHSVFISILTPVEVAATLERRRRDGSLPAGIASLALAHCRRMMNVHLTVFEPSIEMIETAMNLAMMHALKGADAFQLGNAVFIARERKAGGLSSLTFVSADTDLNAAAEAENLIVENPNVYP